MFLNEKNKVFSLNNFNYYLFNILNNEQYQIITNNDNLYNMLEYLIKYKYNNNNKVNDEDFISINLESLKYNKIKNVYNYNNIDDFID